MTDRERVARHYGSAGLPARMLKALELAGKNLGALSLEDLAPVDQFHTGGLLAARQLLATADAKQGWRVLDVGSGLGGPARLLARLAQCHVTGIDITPEFCEAATWLSQLTGLDDATEFRHGDATELPFGDGEFDLALTMQIQMNVADKRRFYAEIFRVLKPRGRFVFQDILSGPGGDIRLPVPWATRGDMSFLMSFDKLRQTLEDVGFRIEALADISEEALAWRRSQPAAGPASTLLGLQVVMGEKFPEMQANQARNLEERRVTMARGAARKP